MAAIFQDERLLDYVTITCATSALAGPKTEVPKLKPNVIETGRSYRVGDHLYKKAVSLSRS